MIIRLFVLRLTHVSWIEHITSNDFLLQLFIALPVCIVDSIPISMHLVNGIFWWNVLSLDTSVIQAILGVKEIGIDNIIGILFRKSQHNIWTLYRSKGLCIINCRLYLRILFFHLSIVANGSHFDIAFFERYFRLGAIYQLTDESRCQFPA